jgi:hypothetical protein
MKRIKGLRENIGGECGKRKFMADVKETSLGTGGKIIISLGGHQAYHGFCFQYGQYER